MLYLIIFVIFILLIFYGYNKTAIDLEVYKLNKWEKRSFDELKLTKQPIIFTHTKDSDFNFLKYKNFPLNCIEGHKERIVLLKDILHGMTFKNGINMSNEYFLNETMIKNRLVAYLKIIDNNYAVCRCDILFMNKKMWSCLKYYDNNYIYIHILQGQVKLKLFLPSNCTTFDSRVCGITGDNVSDYNVWENDLFENIEVELFKDDIIALPRFWWYTILCVDKFAAIGLYRLDDIVSMSCTFNKHLREIITT